jgi:site-specific DNA recombinase
MRAALYARKSNDAEKGASGASLSIERQRELAQAFAEGKGWTVDPANIYQDGALSGADFTNRAGLNALLSAAKSGAFDVLVMMDESRLGREMFETGWVLKRLTDAAVRVWYYQDNREARLDTAIDKAMESFRNFGSELHLEKIRKNTREGLRSRVAGGYWAGGALSYGYRQLREGGRTVLKVHPEHAAVVRSIFDMAAEGKGACSIARTLNVNQTPGPKGGEWGRTTITSLLRNPIYRGQPVYGKRRMTDRGGVRVSVPALESDRIARQDETLRIVSEETWGKVQARLAKAAVRWSGVRTPKGRLAGRPEGVTTSSHLLSGLLKCGGCGAALVPTARSRNGKVRRYYVCSSRYKQGKTACAAKHMLRYDAITDAVLSHFEHLQDGFIDELIAKEWGTWVAERAAAESSLTKYRDEVARLDSELANLTDAVAQGGQSIPALLRALETKQRARDDASARLEHAQGQLTFPTRGDGTPDPGWHTRMATLALGVFGTMRETIERRGPDARVLLRSIILGPITVTHAYDEAGAFVGWDYSGEAALGRLLEGRVPVCHPRTMRQPTVAGTSSPTRRAL